MPIGADVRRIVAGNAGLMTGPGTNTYVLGSSMKIVIDPGPLDDAHLEAILAEGAGRIGFVLATHTHRDHSPLVARLARDTGAMVIGMPPPADGRQDDSFAPGWIPGDGERLRLGERELIAIHTPGHASNCVCYFDEREQLLFTGDHVLQGVSPVILAPDGDMASYFASLDKLLAYGFEYIAPGHGQVMDRGKERIAALRAHRVSRENKVLSCLEALGEASVPALTVAVYDDVPAERHPWARLTLEAHLLKLLGEGRVLRYDEVWRSRTRS